MNQDGLRSLLTSRLKNIDVLNFIWLEIESWIIALVSGLPGNLGFIVRTLIYKTVFDRLGGMSFIQSRVRIVHAKRIRCGKNFTVNSGTYLNGIGQIEFGDNVLIGPNVVISSGEHPVNLTAVPILFIEPVGRRISIGDGVWIGANAVILPGVTIGEGSVIAANAVVTRDVGENEIWGGVPAKKLRSRTI